MSKEMPVNPLLSDKMDSERKSRAKTAPLQIETKSSHERGHKVGGLELAAFAEDRRRAAARGTAGARLGGAAGENERDSADQRRRRRGPVVTDLWPGLRQSDPSPLEPDPGARSGLQGTCRMCGPLSLREIPCSVERHPVQCP